MCYSVAHEVLKLFEVPEADQSRMQISFLTIVIVTLLNRGARGVKFFLGTRRDARTKSRTKRQKSVRSYSEESAQGQ